MSASEITDQTKISEFPQTPFLVETANDVYRFVSQEFEATSDTIGKLTQITLAHQIFENAQIQFEKLENDFEDAKIQIQTQKADMNLQIQSLTLTKENLEDRIAELEKEVEERSQAYEALEREMGESSATKAKTLKVRDLHQLFAPAAVEESEYQQKKEETSATSTLDLQFSSPQGAQPFFTPNGGGFKEVSIKKSCKKNLTPQKRKHETTNDQGVSFVGGYKIVEKTARVSPEQIEEWKANRICIGYMLTQKCAKGNSCPFHHCSRT